MITCSQIKKVFNKTEICGVLSAAVSALMMVFLLLLFTETGGIFITASAASLPDESPTVVSDVDSLLEAICPGAFIKLEKGIYNLTEADSYGHSDGEYFRWDETYDGYELVIVGVKKLTIVGSDEVDVQIVTEPRYANVMSFEDCSDVSLSGLVAGHTVESGICTGGVILLRNTDRFIAEECKLYGCGILGLQADCGSEIKLRNCEIYECSQGAVYCDSCRTIQIEECDIHNCGDNGYYPPDLLTFHACDDIRIENCEIENNNVSSVLSPGYSSDVVFTGNKVSENTVSAGVFDLKKQGTVVEGCSFSDNDIAAWYAGNGFFAERINGDSISGSALNTMDLDRQIMLDVNNTSAEKDIQIDPDDEGLYHVRNVDEFVSAIRPGASILLEGTEFRLDSSTNYGGYISKYCEWRECYDGLELVIRNCDNLSVTGNPNAAETVEISAIPRYANVLTFENCSNLTLTGFTAGHELAPGECAGGVLDLNSCNNITVDNCRLYGCGTTGILAYNCSSVDVFNTEIYDCSANGIYFYMTDGVSFQNCEIHDIGGPMLSFWESGDIIWNDIMIAGSANYDVVDGELTDYTFVVEDFYSEYEPAGLPEGMRFADPNEEFPLGFVEGAVWTNVKAVFDVEGPDSCKKTLFRPNWLPFEPNNEINAWSERDGWYGRISSEFTPTEARPFSMREMDQPFLIEIYYSAQFGADGHPILLYQTPYEWSAYEDVINGNRAICFTAFEDSSEYVEHNYVLLFNDNDGWMVRITGQLDMKTLLDIAWSMEFRTFDNQVTYDDFDSHNVFIDCCVG